MACAKNNVQCYLGICISITFWAGASPAATICLCCWTSVQHWELWSACWRISCFCSYIWEHAATNEVLISITEHWRCVRANIQVSSILLTSCQSVVSITTNQCCKTIVHCCMPFSCMYVSEYHCRVTVILTFLYLVLFVVSVPVSLSLSLWFRLSSSTCSDIKR